ncbi:DUF5343 domain-containing protein [Rhodococcus sp. NPDC057297]|uniref:DUF5343 domain-containing protein n=1 Tax=Rhodococcus sp. NPDC057297 TaxID=3346090 RepID=UPI0036445071
MTNTEPRRSYPYLSIGLWSSLRNAWVKTAPRSVSLDYLQSILGISEKNAKNVQPQLRNLGLIDGENQFTELGKDLRSDDHYASACEKMIEAVYPETLIEVFPKPADDDQERLIGWFTRNAGSSIGTAKVQSKFYAMLASGQPPTTEYVQRTRAAGNSTDNKAKTPVGTGAKETSDPTPPPITRAAQVTPEAKSNGVSLQVNLQIHISPESSSDQIDAIFAGIRKHLNG